MLAVAAEELVRALSRERDRHVAGRELRDGVEPERREVGDWLVQVPEELRQVDHVGGVGQLQLVVVGTERLGDEARVFEFVVRALVAEADGEGLDRLGHVPRHQGDDEARVEAAAQHRAERDVAHQAQAHGLVQQLEQLGRPLVLARSPAAPARELPVGLDVDAAVGDHDPLAAAELAYGGERRAPAGRSRASGRGRSPRSRARCRRRRSRGRSSAGAENEQVAGVRVVDGLDPEPVARHDAAAPPPVPDRDRELAAQLLGERRAVLLVDVGEDLGSQSVRDAWPARRSSARTASWL